MQGPKWWSWEKAVKGMQVLLVNQDNPQFTAHGIVTEVKRSNKSRMIDGKPVKSTNVDGVTILCGDGKEITVKRSESQYQVILE